MLSQLLYYHGEIQGTKRAAAAILSWKIGEGKFAAKLTLGVSFWIRNFEIPIYL